MIESKKVFINETEICEFADDTAIYSCSLNYKEANQKSSNDNKIILNSPTLPSPSLLGGFFKHVFSEEMVKPCFFVTFNIIISHNFSENFIEIPQVAQNTWILSQKILAIFIDFHHFFLSFAHFFVTHKLIASAYKRWCQHFLTFNLL